MEKTGISYKTTTWLFKNYLHKNLKLESYERPQFYNDDIYKIKMLQIGFFDIKNELKKGAIFFLTGNILLRITKINIFRLFSKPLSERNAWKRLAR